MGKMGILKDFFKSFMATSSTRANYSVYHYFCGQGREGDQKTMSIHMEYFIFIVFLNHIY